MEKILGSGEQPGSEPVIPPENLPTAERWSTWKADDSTATIAHSVDGEGVCKITVGGTAMIDTPMWLYVWKVNASYAYTATAGKTYTYTFEARTENNARSLNVQWYNGDNNNEAGVYHNTGYYDGDKTEPNYSMPIFTITSSTWTIYTIKASDPIPKSGVQQLEFQCANQLGTFYVKNIEIEVYFDLQTEVDKYGTATEDMIIEVPRDLSLTGNITVPKNVNGKTLTITSESGGTYTISRGQLNTTADSGLFIVSNGATLVFENIIINGNYKDSDGNINSAFSSNAASLVRVESGSMFTLKNGAVLKNNKAYQGGGVYVNYDGIFNMSGNAKVSGNTAEESGGGVYVRGASTTFTMTGGTVGGTGLGEGNIAGSGGGVYLDTTSTFNMSGGEVFGNEAASGGGVSLSDGSKFYMSGGKVSGNEVTSYGGGIFLSGLGSNTFNMSVSASVLGNTASKGGGVYVNSNCTFTMSGSEISGNYGKNDGGGVYIDGGTFTMSGGKITKNTAGAQAGGGGVYFNNGYFIVGGTAKILGNFQEVYNKNKDAHLYCAGYDGNESRFITLGDGTNDAPEPKTGPDGMVIYVSINEPPTTHNGIIVQSGATAAIANCFHADAFGKGVGYRETGGAEQLYISAVDMVSAIGGSFQMGQNGNGSTGNVTPVHTVTLTQGFSMSKYQVTQGQYQAVMGGTNPSNSHGVGDNYPVYYVSWYDAIVFCNKLSILEGLTPAYRMERDGAYEFTTNPDLWGTVPASGRDARWDAVEIVDGSTGYRLPTEAQWEFAAKGGALASSPYKIYSGSDTVGDVAWYSGNNSSPYEVGTKPVGTKDPNGLGLHDMSGNVWEWCWDWYDEYQPTPQTDPTGPTSPPSPSNRVVRGGGYRQSETEVRSVSRGGTLGPHSNWDDVGFRVVRSVQ